MALKSIKRLILSIDGVSIKLTVVWFQNRTNVLCGELFFHPNRQSKYAIFIWHAHWFVYNLVFLKKTKKMLQLKRVLNSNLIRSIYRNYASVISINADIVKVIKIKPDEYEDSSNSEIRVEMIDGDNNLIKMQKHIAEITQSDTKFKLDCHETKEDTTVILELPIGQCHDIEIKISAVKGKDGKMVRLIARCRIVINCASNKYVNFFF
jgi:hypothetical protein